MSNAGSDGAPAVHVLSAGAAKGLVEALQVRFRDETGARIAGTFNAVGTIRQQFDAGAPCDVLILTQAMLEELARDGRVDRKSITPLGRVATGIAVRSGEAHPAIGDRASLGATLAAATALYCPDIERSTAGIHFAGVLRELGLESEAQAKLRTFASGGIAMKAMADTREAGAIGCTQVTEILYTPGVELVGVLPPAFALATVYAAALGARASRPLESRKLLALLAAEDTKALRVAGGLSEVAQP